VRARAWYEDHWLWTPLLPILLCAIPVIIFYLTFVLLLEVMCALLACAFVAGLPIAWPVAVESTRLDYHYD
jgi:hypothetical protein